VVEGRASHSISTGADSPGNSARGSSNLTMVLSGANGYTGSTAVPMIRTLRTWLNA
jgi:hypothetical protein